MMLYVYTVCGNLVVYSIAKELAMRHPTLDFIPQLPDDQLEAIFKSFIERRIERFRKRPQKTLAKAIELRTTKFRDSTIEVYRTQFYKVVNNLHALRGKTLLDCGVDDLRVAICLEGGGGGFNRVKERPPAVDGDRVKELPLSVFELTPANDESADVRRSNTKLSSTDVRYISLFADVFNSMILDQLRVNNPARMLDGEAEPNYEYTSFFTVEQEKQFLVALQTYANVTTDWMRRRDRALFLIMLGAGLRPSEAVALRIGDLIWHNTASESTARMSIHIRSVNGIHEPRTVSLEAWACPHIFQWAAERSMVTAKYVLGHQSSDLLFPQYACRQQLDTNTVYCSLRNVIELFPKTDVAAIANIKGPNTLRNTFIVRAIHRGEFHDSLIKKVGLLDTKALRRYVAMPYCQKVEKAA